MIKNYIKKSISKNEEWWFLDFFNNIKDNEIYTNIIRAKKLNQLE